MNFIKAFLKKYSALILPMSLLLAGILLFIPTMLIGRTADEKKRSREVMARELDSLTRDTPSLREAELKKQILQRFKQEVETVQTMALQTTQRDLIKYGLFPNPNDTSSQVYLDFGKRYRAAIEHMITDRLKALDAPSDSEIRAQSGMATNPLYPGGVGGEMPGMIPTAVTQNQPSPIVDALCLARAEKITMYANPRIFAWYDFWDSYRFSGSDQAIQDCWFSQTAYWIYEDIVATIETMNAGSERVADSSVKRLLGVSFQRPISDMIITTTYSPAINPLGGMSQQTAGDQPVYILPGLPSPLVSQPWTGRVGNEDLDVIHFSVSVIVDNRFVQTFLKELCSTKLHTYREGFAESGKEQEAQHNQITVLQCTFSSVDKDSPVHAYYRYGTVAVMRVDLVCEYLFYRKAYDPIKPEPVKIILGQSDQVQTTPGMSPGMSPGMRPGMMPPSRTPVIYEE